MNPFMFDSGCSPIQDWPSLFGIHHHTASGSDVVLQTKGCFRESKTKQLQKKRLVTPKYNNTDFLQ